MNNIFFSIVELKAALRLFKDLVLYQMNLLTRINLNPTTILSYMKDLIIPIFYRDMKYLKIELAIHLNIKIY